MKKQTKQSLGIFSMTIFPLPEGRHCNATELAVSLLEGGSDYHYPQGTGEEAKAQK